ncbi:hypothetical protein [Tautonia rosea]|uniref:hypothetical protein n=1 Tax=Tautonia rosea TaxID=2728037 RepID=UPI001474EA58|nr:hypothetical protein [Tautonia rosea]
MTIEPDIDHFARSQQELYDNYWESRRASLLVQRDEVLCWSLARLQNFRPFQEMVGLT